MSLSETEKSGTIRPKYTWYQQQRSCASAGTPTCCELLSEFSTFGISNNTPCRNALPPLVVNCFQNLVPLVSATTKQEEIGAYLCCELLSEFSTFGISNNLKPFIVPKQYVVNCFQNLVPLVSATTRYFYIKHWKSL